MARSKKTPPAAPPPSTGFTAAPADGGLSIDKLAQAFAAMMGAPDPHTTAEPEADVVHVDASPDLDDAGDDDAACRVSPLTILEALLFVGLPGGKPLQPHPMV